MAITGTSILLEYRVSKFLNLAYGSIYAVGAYIAFFTNNPYIAVFIAIVAGSFIGLAMQSTIKKIGRSVVDATIISLGFAILLEEILRLSEQSSYFLIVGFGNKYLNVVGEKISIWYILLSVFALVFYLCLIFVFKSKVGVNVKLIEDDLELAEMYGIDVDKYMFTTTVVISMIAALTGCLLAPTQVLSPNMGFPILVSGIIIAAISSLFGGVGLKPYLVTLALSVVYSYAIGVLV